MFRTVRLAILALIAVGLSACGTTRIGGSENLRVVESAQLPQADPADRLVSPRPYYIGPFDKLSIEVFGVTDLTREEVQVDASGRISFPLIGSIVASGQTPSEVAQEIEGRLRGAYVRQPQVTVNLKETVSQLITISGEVEEPGLYPVIGRMTLLKAVATAKGLTDLASTDDVVVFRTVNGQKYAALYNLGAIQKGAYDDPEMFADDLVIVGRSQTRQWFRDIFQVLPSVTGPLVLAL